MKRVELRLYKHRFSDKWHVEVTAPSRFWLSPNRKFWTRCLKIVKLTESKAKKYFGHYLEDGSFEISESYLRRLKVD